MFKLEFDQKIQKTKILSEMKFIPSYFVFF
jgi:hypothetical protein